MGILRWSASQPNAVQNVPRPAPQPPSPRSHPTFSSDEGLMETPKTRGGERA